MLHATICYNLWQNWKGQRFIMIQRELFGYLAGLKDKKFKQLFLEMDREKFFIKESWLCDCHRRQDADFLKKDYGLKKYNICWGIYQRYYKPELKLDLHSHLQINKSKKTNSLPGVLLKGRGIEKVFSVLMNYLNHPLFVVVGGGEYEGALPKSFRTNEFLPDQVFFLGKSYSGGLTHNWLLRWYPEFRWLKIT